MSMDTEEKFVEFVKQAEQDAAASPNSYATKLALFALLGYVVIFSVLIALLGLAGGLVATAFFSTGLFLLLLKKKLIIAVVFGIWILLRALWVKFDPPQGYTLKRSENPELFAELDELSRQLEALKIHEVILDSSLNAAVVQHPRLGVLGWHRNYLIIGYQLLLALSVEEARSVLAHEFGHLSGNHSRFSGWIYRVRISWMKVMAAFEGAQSWGARLMHKFFNWYSPRFDAYSFALARSNEYEADLIAAELTSPETAAHALVHVHATAPYLNEYYWNNFFRYADERPRPPHAPFKGLSDFLLESPLTRNDMLERIDAEMAVVTHYADTHPSLKDRVGALGIEPFVPSPPEINAAQSWFGARNKQIMEHFDREWTQKNQDDWRQRYEYVSNAKSQLREFSQCRMEDLSDEDLWKFAYWTEEFVSDEAAIPLFQAYQERYPEDPDPAFFIGRTLLGQGNPEGLEQLRHARKSANLVEQTAHIGYDFLKSQNQDEEAETWWQDSISQYEIFIAAQKERDGVDTSDKLIRPEIRDELLQQLISSLRKQSEVGKVWLAQKVVKHFPEDPVYIIAFSTKRFHFSYETIQTKVADELDVEGVFFVACKSGETQALAKKVIKAGVSIL